VSAESGAKLTGGGDKARSEDSELYRLTKLVIGIVLGAAGAAVTFATLHDRIWPPVTVYGGQVVSADIVQAGVSYAVYVQAHPNLFTHPKQAIKKAGLLANRRGAVVAVVIDTQGLRGRHCDVEYTVYRAPFTPLTRPKTALRRCTAHVQNGDEGGWEAWVMLPKPAPGEPPHRLFIRFYLYDSNGFLIGPGKATQTFGWNGVTATA
jgi:hypothetical protein